MKSLVIVNPKAANGKAGRTWPQWRKRLEQTLGDFDVAFTESAGHGEILTRDGLLSGYGHIHAIGGDGTATEVASGFLQNGKPFRPDALFSVWPAGTGCDFHRSLMLSESFKNRGADHITPLDIGRLTYLDNDRKPVEKYFLNIASCGISGFVDQLMVTKWKKMGRMSFLLNTVEGLARYKNRRVHIKTDRGDLGEHVVRVVAVANGKYFGGGMKIAPDAQVDDGKFQLVVLGDVSVVDAILHAPQLYSGQHTSHPKYLSHNITWAEITSDEEVLLDLDGEALGVLPLRVQIIPAAIRLKTFPA
ncbi:MAG: diacylglycerol kinase family lipid kinase [Pseudobdellovibrionaceae bacterium]|nr:diacylglycerol kinase family lipid kinase [Pseudobdellovibrionaceae bacterium]